MGRVEFGESICIYSRRLTINFEGTGGGVEFGVQCQETLWTKVVQNFDSSFE